MNGKTQDEHNENQVVPADQPIPPEIPPETDVEVLDEREPDHIMSEDEMMDHTIEVAKKIEDYERSLNMILNFIIRRCYAGDFVSHDSKDKPLEERTANINNAAAERIARDLGIQEVSRSSLKKEIMKDGHYTYTCQGVFKFRGMKVSAIGQATTKNPFYSKDKGKERHPSEIREDYIRTECIRDLTKQGVRKIFGLRKIPLSKLQELGYDISKVRVVSFAAGAGSQAQKNPQATAGVKSKKWLLLVGFQDKKYGSQAYTVFKAEDGSEFSCWHTGEVLSTLKQSVNKAQVHVELFQKGKYWNIDKVVEVGAL